MRALASYIMRGQLQAITVVVVCGVLSLILSPFSLVAGGAAGLVTLRQGALPGATVTFGGLILASAIGFFASGNTAIASAFLVSLGVTLVPTWLLAMVLRSTISMGITLTVAAAIGALLVVGFYVAVGEPADWWRGMIEGAVGVATEGSDFDSSSAQMQDVMVSVAGMLTGLMAMGVTVGVVMSLFLARGWQALLYNPGGFKTEFYALRLGKVLAVVSLVVVTLATAAGGKLGQIAMDLTWVVWGIYAIAGMAVIHSLAASRQWSSGVLVLLYVLMIIPYVAAFVGFVGWVDTWINLRSKGGGDGGSKEITSPPE